MPLWIHRHRRRLIVAAGLTVLAILIGWLLRGHDTEAIDSYASCAEAGYAITESDPPVCVYHGRSFIGPKASPKPSPEALLNQPFDVLVTGDSHGAYPGRQEIITSAADWRRYWGEVHAGLNTLPPLIPVDFSDNDVVALSEGRQPTGGYNLKVTSIATTSAGTTINFTETIPTVTCNVTQSVTNRYAIVRTAHLTPPISFRLTTDHHRCD